MHVVVLGPGVDVLGPDVGVLGVFLPIVENLTKLLRYSLSPTTSDIMSSSAIVAGKVAVLRTDQAKPFGFLAPDAGGGNVYFNESSLGHRRNWSEFYAIACKYEDCHAPVSFRVEVSRGGRQQAVGVVIHEPEEAALLDADGDGVITETELQAYLAAHPELHERCKTKWEVRQAQQQAEWERRQEDKARKQAEWEERRAEKQAAWERRRAEQQAAWDERQASKKRSREEWEQQQAEQQEEYAARRQASEKLCQQRDALKQRHDAEEQALEDQYSACWDQIKHLQKMRDDVPAGDYAELNRIRAEINQKHAQKNDLRARVKALDHIHDEEMFNYVQDNDHAGRARDGSWLDLHGCELDYVTDYLFPQFLLDAVDKRHDVVEVITGAGNHSEGGHSVIKSLL